MEKDLNELKSIWASGKKAVAATTPADEIIARAEAKKKNVLFSHYGNIAILTLVMIVVGVTFYYIFPWNTALSTWGVHLMVGGLALRIAIEIFSTAKSMRINITDPAVKANEDAIRFYEFRKKVHGPVTVTIVAIYMIGFLLFSPELANNVPLRYVIGLDVMFVVIAFVLARVISKGLRQELNDLNTLIHLRNGLGRD
jgi:hypothetical protein